MKLIDNLYFSYFNSLLRNIDVGDNQIVEGRVDLYSMKSLSTEWRPPDGQMWLSGEEKRGETMEPPQPGEQLSSPVGEDSRSNYAFLVDTLNTSYPDYDFCSVKPTDFTQNTNLYQIESKLHATLTEVLDTPHLFDFTPPSPSLHKPADIFRQIWGSLDEELSLADCVVYSFLPAPGNDPFSENGVLWSLNYFFVNRRSRKLAFLTLTAYSRISSPHLRYTEEADEGLDLFGFEEKRENFQHADEEDMDGDFFL